ncbi:MAG: hypothetical protein IIZ67_01405 [Bacilli bacterium]|nr:hypothetical protein [Bacilli bacterium]
MSKHSYLFMMIALIVVGVVAAFVYQHNNLDKLDEVEDEEVVATPSTTPTVSDDSNDEYGSSLVEYTFKNEFGDGTKTISIKARQVEQLSGFSGATANVYYIDKDYNLYHLELVDEFPATKLATNIKKLELTDDGIVAYFENPYDIVEEDNYVSYKENK